MFQTLKMVVMLDFSMVTYIANSILWIINVFKKKAVRIKLILKIDLFNR
jgi:hypothetical protein